MDKLLIAKAVSRLFHLFSAAFFIGQGFNATTYIVCETPIQSSTGSWLWLLAMITGFTNMIILIILNKPDKSAHKLWKHLLYLKLALMLSLHSHVLRWLLGIFGTPPADVTGIQFFIALLLLVISVGTRYYREDVTKNF